MKSTGQSDFFSVFRREPFYLFVIGLEANRLSGMYVYCEFWIF